MRLSYALAGVPAVLVLCAAVVVALGGRASGPGLPALKAGTDVGRARASLMRMMPVGTPADTAFARLRAQDLSCDVSEPPLANLTWRVIQCSTAPSPAGAVLLVDVAGRNGVVADIGVEDIACASRADVSDPDPEPGGCDMSGNRFLDIETRRRAAGSALLAQVLGAHGGRSGSHP